MRWACEAGCALLLGLAAGCGDSDAATGSGGSGGSGSATTNAGPTSGTGQNATSTTTTTTGSGTSATTGTGAPGTDPCSGNAYTATAPASGAGAEPGNSTPEQHQARLDVDAIRNLLGLHPIDFDAALNQASQAHSDYCSTNSAWCPGWHQEDPGHPGYTGVNFFDRDSAAGYAGGARFEVMATGLGPDGSIQEWLDTVYHRTPFVTPDMAQTGFGHGSGYDTMDFGNAQNADPSYVTNYPVHGQTGVATAWGGNEGPAPPAPPSGFPSGPVISVIFPSTSGVHIVDHKIFDSTCTALPHVAGGQDLPDVGFQGGFLGTTIALYTNAPLTSGATYTVDVEYELGGTPGHRTFQFTTQ